MFKAGQVGRARGNEGIRPISGLARYADLGPARHWEILVSVWSRYQKIQMIDRDGGLCAIADCLAGYERSDVTIRMVVTEDRVRRIDRHIFVETTILDELRAGCFELKTMIDSDIGGSFRFGSAEPLLSTQDERILRWVIRGVAATLQPMAVAAEG